MSKRESGETVKPVKKIKKSHICDECGKSFSKSSNLKVHKMAHLGIKPFSCSFDGCNQAFTQRANLNKHELVHKGIKLFKCKTCNADFSRREHLSAHEETHLDKRDRMFKCDHPPKSWTNQLKTNQKLNRCSSVRYLCKSY